MRFFVHHGTLVKKERMIFMATIYDRIEAVLAEKGMSKQQLADSTMIPYSSLISAFNRKSSSFSHDYLSKIALALQVDINVLMGLRQLPDGSWEPLDDDALFPIPWEVIAAPESKEDELLINFRKLNEAGQEKIIEEAADLTEHPKYRKDRGKKR